MGLAFVFIALSAWAVIKRRSPEDNRLLLKPLIWSIPLPYIANEVGWTLAEVGRQPWTVYGVMKTADAVSPIATSQVAVSPVGFILVYTLLGIADFYPLLKYARRGPLPPRRWRRHEGRCEMLETIWFVLCGVLWTGYSVLDGFDLGLGTLTLWIMLGVALFFVPIVLLYQAWVYRTFSFPIRAEDLDHAESY